MTASRVRHVERHVSLIENYDVGMLKVGSRWRMQRAIDYAPFSVRTLAPVGQKLGIVVLASAMRS